MITAAIGSAAPPQWPELQREADGGYQSPARALHKLSTLICAQDADLTDTELMRVLDAPARPALAANRVKQLRVFLRAPRDPYSPGLVQAIEQQHTAWKSQLLGFALLSHYAAHRKIARLDDEQLLAWLDCIETWPEEERRRAELVLVDQLPYVQVFRHSCHIAGSFGFELVRPDAVGKLLRRQSLVFPEERSWQLNFVLLMPGGIQAETADLWDGKTKPSKNVQGMQLALAFTEQQNLEWRQRYALWLFQAAFCADSTCRMPEQDRHLFETQVMLFLIDAVKCGALEARRLDDFLALPATSMGKRTLMSLIRLCPKKWLSEGLRGFVLKHVCDEQTEQIPFLLQLVLELDASPQYAPTSEDIHDFLARIPQSFHARALRALISHYPVNHTYADSLRRIFPGASLLSLQALRTQLLHPSTQHLDPTPETLRVLLQAEHVLELPFLKATVVQALQDQVTLLGSRVSIWREGSDWRSVLVELSPGLQEMFEELFSTALLGEEAAWIDPRTLNVALLVSDGYYGHLLRKRAEGIYCADSEETPWKTLYLMRSLHSGIERGLNGKDCPQRIPLHSQDKAHVLPCISQSALLQENLERIATSTGQQRWQLLVPLVTAAACHIGSLSGGQAEQDGVFLNLLYEGLNAGRLSVKACQSVLHNYLQSRALLRPELAASVPLCSDDPTLRVPQLFVQCAFPNLETLPHDLSKREATALSDWLFTGLVPSDTSLRAQLAQLPSDAAALLRSNDCPRLVSPYTGLAFDHFIPD